MKRNGKPRTNTERKSRHQRIYGSSKLPPRGTGRKVDTSQPILGNGGQK